MRTTPLINPHQLPVEWLEHSAPASLALRKGRRMLPFGGERGCGLRGKWGGRGVGRYGRTRGFTLLELMVVVAIVGFIAAVALPHVSGFNRANTLTAATRQLMDDVTRARSRALANRSTVYMVFLPAYWNSLQTLENQAYQLTPQFTNLLTHQYAAYALYSSRTVGDQPGQHFPHYLTEWQTLPSGVYIWPQQFNPLTTNVTVYTTNTFNGSIVTNVVNSFPTNVSFDFPSVNTGASMNMPYIGFTPQGTLLTQNNQYIALTRGSIMYAQDSNGVPIAASPDIEEAPPGNTTNNPCLIQIDWLTARPTIVQNQFQ